MPLITFLYPSKVQLLCTLALLGFFVPMGCTPVLLVMFDIYKVLTIAEYRGNAAKIPQKTQKAVEMMQIFRKSVTQNSLRLRTVAICLSL